MTNQTTPIANSFVYSQNRQLFKVLKTTTKVSLKSSSEAGMTETRELHVTTMPESKNLKNEFGSFIFRLVEAETEQKRDQNGRAIAGGINYFPELNPCTQFYSCPLMRCQCLAGEFVPTAA